MGTLKRAINKLDSCNLGWLGIGVLIIILAPIIRLGKGAVFPIHDQLDETILSYVFGAKYWGQDFYPQMMNGISSAGLKPSAILFVPLYMVFDTFVAFVIQYGVVVASAFWGTYSCVKRIAGSSIAALLSAGVFSLLPFRSVYGLSIAGTPLLILCILNVAGTESNVRKRVFGFVGIVYYVLTTNLVLSGYAAIGILGALFIIDAVYRKKINWWLFASILLMATAYLLCNVDLIKQLIERDTVASHREEMTITGGQFFGAFLGIFFYGMQHAESFHRYILIPVFIAIPSAIVNRRYDKKLSNAFGFFSLLIIVNSALYAFFSCRLVRDIQGKMTGMFRSFQFQRFFYLLPGLWYVLLGISIALIMRCYRNSLSAIGLLIGVGVFLPTLFYVAKNPECILYQNVDQINNSDITGHISWEKLYAEDICKEISTDIGLDYEDYRIASIGINPVVALMNGFFTIDGYSNNYPLDYKYEFAEVISAELELNEMNSAYYYNWGSRCYLLYHEWGNAYFVGKNDDLVIHDYRFNTAKMKELGCKYIFSAGEIENYCEHGLNFFGVYEKEDSFWRIWVYELCDDEQD